MEGSMSKFNHMKEDDKLKVVTDEAHPELGVGHIVFFVEHEVPEDEFKFPTIVCKTMTGKVLRIREDFLCELKDFPKYSFLYRRNREILDNLHGDVKVKKKKKNKYDEPVAISPNPESRL